MVSLLLLSLNDQIIEPLPCSLKVMLSLVVAVTEPSQLSVATGKGTVIPHWAFIVDRVGATGFTLSVTVTVFVPVKIFAGVAPSVTV